LIFFKINIKFILFSNQKIDSLNKFLKKNKIKLTNKQINILEIDLSIKKKYFQNKYIYMFIFFKTKIIFNNSIKFNKFKYYYLN
jgi:hypothetical protein